MHKVQHLWNVVNYLSSNSDPEAISLQSYYVERCREMGGEVELPNKIFGPGSMCSHCGSSWSQVEPRVRVGSGMKPAKSVRKIINGVKKARKRVRETLVKKASKNCSNRALIRCSFCSKVNRINIAKPDRLRPRIKSVDSSQSEIIGVKKRRKRTKDKTAGLIMTQDKDKARELNRKRGVESSTNSNRSLKLKSTNLNKLGAMINRNITPSKKSSLHDFISELGGG